MLKIIKISIFALLALSAMYAFSYYSGINKPLNMNGQTAEFTVNIGDSVDKIAAELERSGLVASARHFKTYVYLNDRAEKLQAGTFYLSPAMSVKEITNALVSQGGISREKNVKIIEGWNIAQIDDYLKKNSIIPDSEHFKNDYREKAETALANWPFDFAKPDFLTSAPDTAGLEGYLFPDTYRIFNDASAGDLIKKQLDNFDSKLSDELLAEIAKQGKTLHEIVTMASIIEKEVALDKDRALVSGILNKRMEIGMRLEVDASINYITGKNDPAALSEDLDIESPYNTYRNDGLPPGPICNPGFSAIKAAIYPEKSEYLFYLNRQDTKETIFSKDYNEHLRNKAKYLK